VSSVAPPTLGATQALAMSREERVAKFRTCASRVLGAADVERALTILENLDNLPDVRELVEVLDHARAD
jgi:hypothetical protein